MTEHVNILNEALHCRACGYRLIASTADAKILRFIGILWAENAITASMMVVSDDEDRKIYFWAVEQLEKSRIFETLEAAKACARIQRDPRLRPAANQM
jgi:hypothetical protein